MTEKRYSLVYYADKGGTFIKNNETGTEWYHDSIASLLEIVNELNGLTEENEQLKQFIQELTTKGTDKIHLANGSIYKVDAILTDFKM